MEKPQTAECHFRSCDPGRRAGYVAALSSILERTATKIEAQAIVSDNLTAASFLRVLSTTPMDLGPHIAGYFGFSTPTHRFEVGIADFSCGLGMRCIQAALWFEYCSVDGYDSNHDNIMRANTLAERMLCGHDQNPTFPPIPAPAHEFPHVNLPHFHHKDIMDVACIDAEFVMASWQGWAHQAKCKLGQLFTDACGIWLVIFQCRCTQPSLMLQGLGFPAMQLDSEAELRVRGGGKQRVHAYCWKRQMTCLYSGAPIILAGPFPAGRAPGCCHVCLQNGFEDDCPLA